MFPNLSADLTRFQEEGESWSMGRALRGFLSQGFQAIWVYRFFHALQRRGLPSQPVRFVVERWTEITTGIQIPASCKIGKGLRIHHFGGIVMHPTTEIGENCTVYHGVTIGDRGGKGGAAKIGDRVLLGAGAKVIGEISIGDDSLIGANAVVREDVPAGSVAFGNPAQIQPRRSRQAEADRV